jgi:hypothetical protein
MSLRPSDQIRNSRPDNTSTIVGGSGVEVLQDTDGTQIQRLGIPGAEADWGPGEIDITDGEAIIADPESVGGTSELSGIVRSVDGVNLSVVFVWTTGENDYATLADARNQPDTLVEEPSAVQDSQSNLITSLKTKADHAAVFAVDESDGGVTNNIEYTLNFH